MTSEGDRSVESLKLVQKFRGTLVGAAIGDALGARFEGQWSVNAVELERLDEEPGRLRYTDDTHMTLGMAESLVERKGFDGPHMADVFVRNFVEEPWRGYGPGPPKVFRLLKRRVPWDQAGRTLFGGSGSFGNGAAMRVAPAALLAFRDLERVRSLAKKTALITHTHDLGIVGATLQACAVAHALGRGPAEPIDHAAFLDTLRSHIDSSMYAEKLEWAGRLLAVGDRSDRKSVVAQLGNGIEAISSVPTAVYAFLRHTEFFKAVGDLCDKPGRRHHRLDGRRPGRSISRPGGDFRDMARRGGRLRPTAGAG